MIAYISGIQGVRKSGCILGYIHIYLYVYFYGYVYLYMYIYMAIAFIPVQGDSKRTEKGKMSEMCMPKLRKCQHTGGINIHWRKLLNHIVG